jgi:DNA-binding NarL/FixJ family response regulator
MAEQVCSDEQIPADSVLGLLISLIDKSLVVLDREVAGDARYRLLDTIREYALSRVADSGEEPALRRRHRDCILRFTEEADSCLVRRGEPAWTARMAIFHRLLAERDNFRIAFATSLDSGDAAEGLRQCTALRYLRLLIRGLDEATRWLDAFLACAAEVPPVVLARAVTWRGELAFEQQDYEAALRHALRGLELCRSCGDDFTVPQALQVLGQVALRTGHYDEALARVAEAAAAAETSGNDWEAGIALYDRAVIESRQGKLRAAQRSYEAALAVLYDNHQFGVAHVHCGMGILAGERGDHEAALRHFEAALPVFLQLEAPLEIARCLAGMGRIALAQGNLGLGQARLAESLQLSQAAGQRLAIARGLEAIAELAAAEQQPERAVRLAGAALALRETIGQAHGAGSRLENLLDPVRGRLGDAAAAALLAEGRALTPDEAVAYALAPGQEASGEQHPGQARASGQPAPVRSAPSPASASPLTPREQEIAALIVRGLSNRGIADELVISPATAARHVANILTKLGFSSRAQIAAWAVRHAAGDSIPATVTLDTESHG